MCGSSIDGSDGNKLERLLEEDEEFEDDEGWLSSMNDPMDDDEFCSTQRSCLLGMKRHRLSDETNSCTLDGWLRESSGCLERLSCRDYGCMNTNSAKRQALALEGPFFLSCA